MELQTQHGLCVPLTSDTPLTVAGQTGKPQGAEIQPSDYSSSNTPGTPPRESLPSSSSLSFRGENTSELSQKEIRGRKWKV